MPVPEELDEVDMVQEPARGHMVRVQATASQSEPILVHHQFASQAVVAVGNTSKSWAGVQERALDLAGRTDGALEQAELARDQGLLEMALEEIALDHPRFGSLVGG